MTPPKKLMDLSYILLKKTVQTNGVHKVHTVFVHEVHTYINILCTLHTLATVGTMELAHLGISCSRTSLSRR